MEDAKEVQERDKLQDNRPACNRLSRQQDQCHWPLYPSQFTVCWHCAMMVIAEQMAVETAIRKEITFLRSALERHYSAERLIEEDKKRTFEAAERFGWVQGHLAGLSKAAAMLESIAPNWPGDGWLINRGAALREAAAQIRDLIVKDKDDGKE